MRRTLICLTIVCSLASTLAATGCTGSEKDSDNPSKQQLIEERDELDWCSQLGLQPGCDICDELGYYGDGVCDLNLINAGLCAGPDPDCSPAVCGNGVVDAGEECDDGNSTDGDGCSTACLLETGSEVCDNGSDDDMDGLVDCEDTDCSVFCAEPVCGNGIVEQGEMCDDGNNTDGDGCSSLCMQEVDAEICSNGADDDRDGAIDCQDSDCSGHSWCNAACGNGVVEPGEECDDGNSTDGDGCSSFCTLENPQSEICDNGMDDDMDGVVDCADVDCDSDPACAPLCGNGVIEPTSGEECDIDDFGGETCQTRGYASGTLTCTPSCTIDDGGCTPFDCGDGILSPGEECDDGNNTDGDGCSSDCTIEPPPEICEDRVDNDGDGLVDCADPDCASDPFCLCGNGIIEGNEECDDGNNTDGDGCSSSCTLESPQSEICDNGMDDDMDGLVDCLDSDCANDPACGPSCGNGFLEPGEACDDGNRDNTDSCPDDPSTGGTCQPAACGDGHLYQGVEECDTTDLDGETCQSLGYNSGTLTCGATCTFDTSNCQ